MLEISETSRAISVQGCYAIRASHPDNFRTRMLTPEQEDSLKYALEGHNLLIT